MTDEDFTKPTRNVQLPELPENVAAAIGTDGKPVVIKKNIFEKNSKSHKDLTPTQSREILHAALYNADLYGQNKKASKPYNWILIHLNGDRDSAVLIEVANEKDRAEIVNWHYLRGNSLRQKERQAIKEGGLILALPDKQDNAAGDASDNLPSGDKDRKESSTTQGKQPATAEKGTYGRNNEGIRFAIGGERGSMSKEERVSATQSAAEDMQGKFGIKVEAIESPDDVPNKQARKRIAAGENVKGWYDPKTGKVYLYAPNIESAQDAMATYAHEVIAHKGMEGLLGKERYAELCKRLGKVLTPEQRKLVKEYEGSDSRTLGDEYIARIAETLIDENGNIKEPTTWEKVKAVVRDFFRDVFGLDLTDADIRYMLWRSAEGLRRGNANEAQRERDVETERGLKDETARMRLEEADYQREVREITERAKADGTFMKAPNGKPSNLNERQWAHVRTSRFKQWFGDWELRHRVVKIVTGRIDHGFKNFAEARKWAKDNLVRVYSNVETGGKGEIRISGRAVDKFLSDSSISKSDNKEVHLAVLKTLPDVLHESIDAEQHPDRKKGVDGTRDKANGLNSIDIIHRLFGVVEIGGKTYRVKTTVKELVRQNGEKTVHSYEATEIELLAGQTEKGVPFSRNSNNSISTANLLQGIESANNPGSLLLENHSKVVDENGEPKVVYHQTNASFNSFDITRARTSMEIPAFFFAPGYDAYHGYGDNTIAAFLNLRNPIENPPIPDRSIDDGGMAVRKMLADSGHDGFARSEDDEGIVEYAAFYPNQIKSATDNIGTYDRNNDDIRFAIGSERGSMSQEERVSATQSAAEDMQKEFNVEAEVVESLDDVQDAEARKRIAAGEAVKGWYDPGAGKVCVYMRPTSKAGRTLWPPTPMK